MKNHGARFCILSIKIFILFISAAVLLIIAAGCAGNSDSASSDVSEGIVITDNGYHGNYYNVSSVWLATSVRNDSGELMDGLDADDFQLTEYIISKADNSIKAEADIDLPSFAAADNENLGLYSRVTGGEPLDIVVLVDDTGTMTDYYAGIKTELKALINEMIETHVDFRVALRSFGSGVANNSYFEFRGPEKAGELPDLIDAQATSGESWIPSAAYDALFFTPWLGFRENARKICLVITDVVPRTAYGVRWTEVPAATQSAVELFLQETGIELFYSQRDWTHGDLHVYYDEEINPRAGDTASGFSALKDEGGDALAVQISFPFDREELKAALGIGSTLSITDTEYLLCWQSSFDPWNAVEDGALVYYPDDYELRVTLKVPDPGNADKSFESSCTYPIAKQLADIVINTTGEDGGTPIPLSFVLSTKMGDKEIRRAWGNVPENGQIIQNDLACGTYNFLLYEQGLSDCTYYSLRAVYRGTITINQESMTFDVTVPVADRESELSKARGLLEDIGNWRLPGDPFQSMVDDSNAWLDSLEDNGLTWEEMAAIKRFYVGLAGYASIIEFSQREAEMAIDDFNKIVQNFRDILDEVDKITEDPSIDDVFLEIASTAIELLAPGVAVEKEALEAALEELTRYAVEELTQDLRERIIAQFPAGDYNSLLQIIVNTLVDAGFEGGSLEPDWDAVITALRAISLDKAIDAVQSRVISSTVDTLIDSALQRVSLPGALNADVKALVKTIITALISGDMQSDTLSKALENFATSVAEDVQSYGRDYVANAVIAAFGAVNDALTENGIDPDVSGFLVGIAMDMTLQAIPFEVNGIVSYSIDTDAVVSVLVKYGVYYVILKNYCINDVQDGLDYLLSGATAHTPTGEDPTTWCPSMQTDFTDYSARIRDLHTTAWNALKLQEEITSWAEQLEELCDIMETVSEPLDFLANIYPDLQDTAENVHAFISILDGMQIVGNAISFGLKVDSLDTFGKEAEPMYQELFY